MFKDLYWQNIYGAGEACANNFLPFDTWPRLLLYAENIEGATIYAQMQQKTEALNTQLTRLPLVTINGEISIPGGQEFVQGACRAYMVIINILGPIRKHKYFGAYTVT